MRTFLHVENRWRVVIVVLVAGILGQALFVLVSRAVINQDVILEFDADVSTALYEARQSALIDFFEVFTMSGSQVLYSLGFGLAMYFIWRRRWAMLAGWAVAMGIGTPLNNVLKQVFARPRPAFDDWVPPQTSYGYPSGHVMLSLLAYGMLAYLGLAYVRTRGRRAALILGVIVWVALIGFSRLYLNVHFFSDVVGGAVTGSLWLLTSIAVFTVLRSQENQEDEG